MSYERAVYGDYNAFTEGSCCEKCGRPAPVSIHGLEVGAKGVSWRGKHVPFSVMETEFFRMIAKGFGHPVHKNRIFSALYSGQDGGPGPKIMDVWICKIRKKLKAEALPFEIKTHWGVGFQLLALNVEN